MIQLDDLTGFLVNLSLDQPDHPQYQEAANHTPRQAPHQAIGDDSNQSKQKATQQGSQDPYYEISKQAKASSFGDLACPPARPDSYEHNPNPVQHRDSPATRKCNPRLGVPIAPCGGLFPCAVSARFGQPLLWLARH